MIEWLLNIIASIFTISGTNVKDLCEKNKKRRNTCIAFVVLALIICVFLYKKHSVTVTNVTLNVNSLTLNMNESHSLTATVLYSNNSMSNDVLWSSSNESIATVDQNGLVTALATGNTTIIAQASKNNTTEISECTLTVKSPPSGYSISVHQLTEDSYAYVYVQPYDRDITHIQIYGKSPSGEIFAPKKDENDLYHFYSECGTWTIYASVENSSGIYEAHRPEDFVTIEVTDTSDILGSSLEMFDDIFKKQPAN